MSGDQPGNEPEETMPFTHRPYGAEEPENPFTSPSSTSSQPSGPDYQAPGPGEPPSSSTPWVPYGQPPDPASPYQSGPYQPAPWQQAWAPVPGSPYGGSRNNQRATTSLVLGIISVVSIVLAPLTCCLSLPGALCAPFAWVIGARARREIDAAPGVYGNRGAAQTGFIMGIVCSLLGILVLVLGVLYVMLVSSDLSLV